MHRVILYILLLLLQLTYSVAYSTDTTRTLSEQEFISIVKTYHPIAKQSNILVEQAESGVTIARGKFDPLLQSNVSKKELSNTTYYNYQISQLQIPTWYGIELNAGIERVGGERVDPQETYGTSSFAGITVPLLKNLVLDKRRAFLQQAKIMVSQSENERNIIINDLLKDALVHYWNWVESYASLQVVNEVVNTNRQRIEFTKTTILQGERAGIDSVEAITQLQQFLALQNELEVQYRNATVALSAFTWDNTSQPYDLPEDLKPDADKLSIQNLSYHNVSQQEYVDFALNSHPELKVYSNKFAYLDVYKRLTFQNLLPNLDLRYNQLGKNYNLVSTLGQPLLQNNYQYGLSFAMPLRLSEARGEYKQAKLKIQQTQLDFDYKRRVIYNKVVQQFNTLVQLQKQLSIQNALLQNQKALLEGEDIRFQNGESSLFLINTREQKVIETKQKLVSLMAKYYKQIVTLKWAAGMWAN